MDVAYQGAASSVISKERLIEFSVIYVALGVVVVNAIPVMHNRPVTRAGCQGRRRRLGGRK